MQAKIKEKALSLLPEIIGLRRHFHRYPELSLQEYKTSEFIEEKLREYGISYEKGIAKTGIIAWIYGKNPAKKCIALRADMDALPVEESNDVDFKSQNAGVMHACGHDVHMASLLGTAQILNSLKDSFEGTVMLIFQPSEEKSPGGASIMLDEGIFDKRKPEAIFAFHVLPEMNVGRVGFKSGNYMASADEIYLTVKGKGGHAGTPHMNIDPVVIASHIVIALQQIVSRNAPPTIPSILSFGKVEAKGATNVVPNEVRLEGTLRTFNEEWRKEALSKIRKMSEGIAESMGGFCEVHIAKGYPVLTNDADLTNFAKFCAQDFLSTEKVEDMDLRMTAEDFAFFAQEIPGCYFRVGTRKIGSEITNLHTSGFTIDEEALQYSMGLMAYLAIESLK